VRRPGIPKKRLTGLEGHAEVGTGYVGADQGVVKCPTHVGGTANQRTSVVYHREVVARTDGVFDSERGPCRKSERDRGA
jgi:hypothetical protein